MLISFIPYFNISAMTCHEFNDSGQVLVSSRVHDSFSFCAHGIDVHTFFQQPMDCFHYFLFSACNFTCCDRA
jgi:hypothetical protein